MLLQLLQLVLGISIYSQIFFFWYYSLLEGFFPWQSAFKNLKRTLLLLDISMKLVLLGCIVTFVFLKLF